MWEGERRAATERARERERVGADKKDGVVRRANMAGFAMTKVLHTHTYTVASVFGWGRLESWDSSRGVARERMF